MISVLGPSPVGWFERYARNSAGNPAPHLTPHKSRNSSVMPGSCFESSSFVKGKKSFFEKKASLVSAKYSCGFVRA